MMEQESDLRLKLQIILAKLGKRRAANTSEVFRPSSYSSWRLSLYILYIIIIIGLVVSLFFSMILLPILVGLILSAMIFHNFATRRIETDVASTSD